MSTSKSPDDDPDVRRAAERQISLHGADAVTFVPGWSTSTDIPVTSLCDVGRILAKIQELQAGQPKGDDAVD
jgi:hypothetical protein